MKESSLYKLSFGLLVTYGNALLGVLGCVAVLAGAIDIAFILLVGAALLDAFDGVVARMKRQSPYERRLGIVADSVADMVSFGVLPAVLLVAIAGFNWLTVVAIIVYVAAAIHRLVVFSADALETSRPTQWFTGMPVIAGPVLLTIVYVLFGTLAWFPVAMAISMATLGVLFVSGLPVPKPHGKIAYTVYPLLAVALIAGIILW